MSEEIKDFQEVKQKKKRVPTEKQKKALENAREKLAIKQANKWKTIEDEIQKLHENDEESQYIIKKKQDEDEDEVDLETLLDKKLKKWQQKTDKYDLLKKISVTNSQLFDKVNKMEERIEKMYSMKKAKSKLPQP